MRSRARTWSTPRRRPASSRSSSSSPARQSSPSSSPASRHCLTRPGSWACFAPPRCRASRVRRRWRSGASPTPATSGRCCGPRMPSARRSRSPRAAPTRSAPRPCARRRARSSACLCSRSTTRPARTWRSSRMGRRRCTARSFRSGHLRARRREARASRGSGGTVTRGGDDRDVRRRRIAQRRRRRRDRALRALAATDQAPARNQRTAAADVAVDASWPPRNRRYVTG